MDNQHTPPCPFCGKPYPPGAWPICDDGTGKHGHEPPHLGTNVSSIHPRDRSVVYRNPKTGERRTPARNDQPMPEVYSRQGYVREELDTFGKLREYERSTGSIHEASHYHRNSSAPEKALEPPPLTNTPDPVVHKQLIDSLRTLK